VGAITGGVERRLHQRDHRALDLPRALALAPGQAQVVELPLAQAGVVAGVEDDLVFFRLVQMRRPPDDAV
jgi:hypothetical protein